MIIFNYSIGKFYQCSVQNSPRQSSNAEAFAKTYIIFLEMQYLFFRNTIG